MLRMLHLRIGNRTHDNRFEYQYIKSMSTLAKIKIKAKYNVRGE